MTNEIPVTIEMGWLQGALDELKWDDAGEWLKDRFREAIGHTVAEKVSCLTPEHRQEFVAEVQLRLEDKQTSEQETTLPL